MTTSSEREYLLNSKGWEQHQSSLIVVNRVLRKHGLQIVFDVRTDGFNGFVHVVERIVPMSEKETMRDFDYQDPTRGSLAPRYLHITPSPHTIRVWVGVGTERYSEVRVSVDGAVALRDWLNGWLGQDDE